MIKGPIQVVIQRGTQALLVSCKNEDEWKKKIGGLGAIAETMSFERCMYVFQGLANGIAIPPVTPNISEVNEGDAQS